MDSTKSSAKQCIFQFVVTDSDTLEKKLEKLRAAGVEVDAKYGTNGAALVSRQHQKYVARGQATDEVANAVRIIGFEVFGDVRIAPGAKNSS